MDADFNTLAVQARDAQNNLGVRAFVTAALGLDQWYCVGIAPDDAPDEPEPLIAPIDNEPHLIAFTDEERATSFAERRAAQRGGQAITLELDVPDAVHYARAALEQNVTGIHFNDGDFAVSVPTRRLLDLAGH